MKRLFTYAGTRFAPGAYFILLLFYAANAQNASYNANTIPIGGTFSTALGWEALKVNAGGSNTGIGFMALRANTTGSNNTSLGYGALLNNISGSLNTANGSGALGGNTTGSENTANGSGALGSNTSGSMNTANGSGALLNNKSGLYNTANGHDALRTNISGSYNTANGTESLFSNSTGDYNTANGFQALLFNSTGKLNTANGHQALFKNQTGSNNLALGDSAGYNSLGNGNIFMGHRAGANETGSNKFYLGNEAANTLIYGDMATRQILMGNANPTGYAFKGGRTLNVLGGVLTDSVRVALSAQWSDYVFDDHYPLMPLEELSKFIKANRHLPGIPAASEVKANGIELGEMNAKLLARIEELTLYLLQQQEQIKAQQAQINELIRLAGNNR